MNNNFFVYNFGCRVNQADALEVRRKMLEAGHDESENNPGILIINTCCVTQKAEKEAKQFIRSKKRDFPRAEIIVTGCAATKWGGKRTPFNIEKIGIMAENSRKNIYEQSGRALIKIQDGCDRYCSYCIVPSLRGESKSKKIDQVIGEIRVIRGIREVILTAINTDLYGKDTGESLTGLVRGILDQTKIERLSFGSINPNSFTPELLKLFKSPMVAKYFHIPIQSGSNKILKLMKRGYKIEDVRGRLEDIKGRNELTLIGTDIIVGFPGETEEDFKLTYKFLEGSPISKFHIFRFSKREGTAAWKLVDKLGEVPEAIKKQRAKDLEDLENKKYRYFLDKHINKSFKALFLVRKVGKYQEALLENNILAKIETEKDYKGQIKRIKVTSQIYNSLFGQVPS